MPTPRRTEEKEWRMRRFWKWIRETFFAVPKGAPWCEEPVMGEKMLKAANETLDKLNAMEPDELYELYNNYEKEKEAQDAND
jgi:hypothetical protein